MRHHLDKVLWTNREHIDVRQVQDYFAQYLYLPRLTYQELIIEGVRDGVASLTWPSDTFAYAASYDEENKRYIGLQAGRTGVAIVADGRSVIVKPAVARVQLEKEAVPSPQPTSTPGGTVVPSKLATGNIIEPGAPSPSRPTHFHGSIAVDATRLARDAATISTEVLQHLASKLGANVEIVLDINAHIPGGVDEATVRIITENCRTLGFDQGSGFEK